MSKQEITVKGSDSLNNNQRVKIVFSTAVECTGTDPKQISYSAVCTAIATAFPGIKETYVIEALKKGMFGFYGRTYKLTVQEICCWMHEYLKTTPEYKLKKKQEEGLR